ncbi:hypothetical protein N8199_04465 [Emcibacteraceae bacterium]|nr:hypothetical protein [Emcibacteraceae bacterium]
MFGGKSLSGFFRYGRWYRSKLMGFIISTLSYMYIFFILYTPEIAMKDDNNSSINETKENKENKEIAKISNNETFFNQVSDLEWVRYSYVDREKERTCFVGLDKEEGIIAYTDSWTRYDNGRPVQIYNDLAVFKDSFKVMDNIYVASNITASDGNLAILNRTSGNIDILSCATPTQEYNVAKDKNILSTIQDFLLVKTRCERIVKACPNTVDRSINHFSQSPTEYKRTILPDDFNIYNYWQENLNRATAIKNIWEKQKQDKLKKRIL